MARVDLNGIGVWSSALRYGDRAQADEAAAELESLGYTAVWVPDVGGDVFGAVAIANTIAYISELIDPTSIFLGLTRQNLMTQSLRYLLWGEGETALMVYTILLRYWEWTPDEDIRPLIFLMSE